MKVVACSVIAAALVGAARADSRANPEDYPNPPQAPYTGAALTTSNYIPQQNAPGAVDGGKTCHSNYQVKKTGFASEQLSGCVLASGIDGRFNLPGYDAGANPYNGVCYTGADTGVAGTLDLRSDKGTYNGEEWAYCDLVIPFVTLPHIVETVPGTSFTLPAEDTPCAGRWNYNLGDGFDPQGTLGAVLPFTDAFYPDITGLPAEYERLRNVENVFFCWTGKNSDGSDGLGYNANKSPREQKNYNWGFVKLNATFPSGLTLAPTTSPTETTPPPTLSPTDAPVVPGTPTNAPTNVVSPSASPTTTNVGQTPSPTTAGASGVQAGLTVAMLAFSAAFLL